tara:strand:+ start:45740 stop:46156 length:417 start_codon:yes stop_codon:yes gene_type:complete
MRAKITIQLLSLFIITLLHIPVSAQYTATSVMNVTVEVVDGSSVEMNQNDLITFNDNSPSEVIFAIFSVSHGQENSILTSASQTIEMINGIDRVEMMSILTENRDEKGQITLEFSTGVDNNFINGTYTGKQIAEIIYL